MNCALGPTVTALKFLELPAMNRGGCLATSLLENFNLKTFFFQHENDGVSYLKQENDKEKNHLKYFSIFDFKKNFILFKQITKLWHVVDTL